MLSRLAKPVNEPAAPPGAHGRRCTALDHGPWRDDAAFGHDDDATADDVAVAVDVIEALLVHQAHAVADAGVLVDDGASQYHIAADAQPWFPGQRLVLVEVRPENHGLADVRAVADARPKTDDGLLHRAPVQIA